MADINNDNQADMIIGNVSGGISYFSSDSSLNDTNTIISDIINNIDTKLNIFPNPTTKSLTIHSEMNGMLQINNLLGKLVYTKIKNNKELKINTSQFPKGIYFIRLNKNTKKLIIE